MLLPAAITVSTQSPVYSVFNGVSRIERALPLVSVGLEKYCRLQADLATIDVSHELPKGFHPLMFVPVLWLGWAFDRNPEARSATEMKHIDHAVAQFRAAWDSGTRPRIEDFLADTGDAARAELLMRLLAEELACRICIGETPAAEEYEQRPPVDAETVRQAFNRSKLGSDLVFC